MELPDLGEHCCEPSCRQLDYLPMKCDACQNIFCSLHLHYDEHKCSSKHKKDIQVPVCPLCNCPVPTPRGTLPDLAVSAHIDQDCRSDKAKKRVFTNRCCKPKCKKRELVPIVCDSCQQNFCLTHRHTKDHNCEGRKAVANQAAAAAASRAQNKPSTQAKISSFFTGPFRPENPPTRPTASSSRPTASSSSRPTATGARAAAGYVYSSNVNQVQRGMTEDEALAAALAASMADSSLEQRGGEAAGELSQEEEDRLLAQALAESERTARSGNSSRQQQTVGGDQSKSCRLS